MLKENFKAKITHFLLLQKYSQIIAMIYYIPGINIKWLNVSPIISMTEKRMMKYVIKILKIGTDGRIAMYVEEKNRSWCSSSASNDHRAVTIEVANNGGGPDWPVSDEAYDALLDLVTDICKRNNITKLLWKGDKSLIGQVNKQNMTVHRWFAAKACPGDYLYNLHPDIVEKVNKRL